MDSCSMRERRALDMHATRLNEPLNVLQIYKALYSVMRFTSYEDVPLCGMFLICPWRSMDVA